ncbi:DUF6763 family protein [Inmirania thermothiophila]|uniref:Uncharacterized protein n=1 Tax=Inmirania thermothiophila TaxID=1750597 RepID=A0A3N1Y7T5_9GAMM|nr:DUF6763 family protein [Inmirania thermothiophila]ROR34896.1 hypothetical protein EDC57_0805 [Inmirania thermothiophila]
MSTPFEPRVGDWYRKPNGETFEVVAVDEADETVEIQYFDGDLEEFDFESWYELDLEPIDPPEDWSGPFDDLEPDDLGEDVAGHGPVGDYLDEIDRED